MRKLAERVISYILYPRKLTRPARPYVVYAAILTSTFCGLKYIFYYFDFVYTDIDNIRYLLSAMAQSQAAIIAIIITITLVAVQLTATSYSPRVVSIFKTSFDLWVLFILYAGSILYDCLILMILSRKTSEFCVFIAYWLCASSVLSLIPYMVNMMDMLNPEVIVRKLVKDIDLAKPGKFKPIIEIIRRAFIKSEYETARNALATMTTRVTEIINSSHAKRMPYRVRPFSWSYIDVLGELGEFFARRDEEFTLKIISNLQELAEVVRKRKIGTEYPVAHSLNKIGKCCAQKGFQIATTKAIDTVASIVRRLPCDRALDAQLIISETLRTLDNITTIVGKTGYRGMFMTMNLKALGIKLVATADNWKNIWQLTDVANSFHAIGITWLNLVNNPSNIVDRALSQHVILPLKLIASAIGTPWFLFSWDEVPGKHEERFQQFLYWAFDIVIFRRHDIEKADNETIIRIKEHELGLVLLRLNKGKTEVQLEIDNRNIAKFYPKLENGKINVYCRKQKLTLREDALTAFKRFVFALWDVGSYAAIIGLEKTWHEAAKALSELALLEGEEVVEGELSKLRYRETKSDRFQKFEEFVKTYKNLLKKLREPKG